MALKIFFLCLLLSLNLNATEWTFIKTDHGTDLEIKIIRSSMPLAPLLVIAPGQSCNSKGALFEAIEREAIKKDLSIARFEWSYCSPNASVKNPSDDLSAEVNDLNFAVTFAKDQLNLATSDILLSGKSLGSMVAYEFFRTRSDFKSLSLLTPVCSYNTDEQGNPLPAPLNVINENYPKLLSETRPVLLISGNQDPLCFHPYLKDFETRASKSFKFIYAQGDHGFGITRVDGTQDPIEKQNNLTKVANDLIKWFKNL